MSTTEQPRELWGGETKKAIGNFPVSGQPVPAPVVRWLGQEDRLRSELTAGGLGPFPRTGCFR